MSRQSVAKAHQKIQELSWDPLYHEPVSQYGTDYTFAKAQKKDPGTGRSLDHRRAGKVIFEDLVEALGMARPVVMDPTIDPAGSMVGSITTDRKSTRLNSSHRCISYAVFCLKK